MPLQSDQRELLRRTHNFADWAQGGGPTLRGFTFNGGELPGWELVKSQFKEALNPPRLDTFWRPKGADSETLLGVHVIEAESVPAAREALLDALGEFQSAVIRRRTDINVGEVVFGQEFMLVFARANLVIFVRNAGKDVTHVLEPARTIDAHIARLLRERGVK